MIEKLRNGILLALFSAAAMAATYPPQSQLAFHPMPVGVALPGYLVAYEDLECRWFAHYVGGLAGGHTRWRDV